MSETTVPFVNNLDVPQLYALINRMVYECQKCPSANSQRMLNSDMVNFNEALDAFVLAVSEAKSDPEIHTPKTHPENYELTPPNKFSEVENLCLNHAQHGLSALRNEIANSASSRDPSGVSDKDSERWLQIVTKVRTGMVNRVKLFENLEFPESSPQIAGITAGRTGLNTNNA